MCVDLFLEIFLKLFSVWLCNYDQRLSFLLFAHQVFHCFFTRPPRRPYGGVFNANMRPMRCTAPQVRLTLFVVDVDSHNKGHSGDFPILTLLGR